jgi:hypothetical protein
MADDQQFATGGFIQFGDGPKIPVTNVCMTLPELPTAPTPEAPLLKLSDLPAICVEVPMAIETAVGILRAVGMPEAEVDRVEVEAHPDLIELDRRL